MNCLEKGATWMVWVLEEICKVVNETQRLHYNSWGLHCIHSLFKIFFLQIYFLKNSSKQIKHIRIHIKGGMFDLLFHWDFKINIGIAQEPNCSKGWESPTTQITIGCLWTGKMQSKMHFIFRKREKYVTFFFPRSQLI